MPEANRAQQVIAPDDQRNNVVHAGSLSHDQ